MLSFLDMDSVSLSVERRLRWFDRLLLLASIALAFGSVVTGITLAISMTGRGNLSVPVSFRPPVEVTFADGRSVVTSEGRPTEYRDFPMGEEAANLRNRVEVRTQWTLGRDDRDSRVTLAIAGLLLGASLWFGLVSLRRVVRSARLGESFGRENVRRLRVLGASIWAWPLITRVAAWVLESTIDATPPVRLVVPGPAWWQLVLLGLGMFALAEVWREGVEMRDLERGTV